MLKIFGAVGSGSVPIEATLTLLGIPYEVIEAVTWEDEAARKRVETVNPLGQVPALVLPSGEIMTESAAILIYLARSLSTGTAGARTQRPRTRAISTLDDLCVGGDLRICLDQGRRDAYRRQQRRRAARDRSRS
ncbi:glutathione S-transferase N-terminal domain-containing protein [Mesorhizobium sp.]|uniref:glutathione S-transferase N-terminal domain-containing protein n=1 Tax=Mesorhizobium sp. TaxID=1871066 RepID=UPI003390074A